MPSKRHAPRQLTFRVGALSVGPTPVMFASSSSSGEASESEMTFCDRRSLQAGVESAVSEVPCIKSKQTKAA